MEVPPYSLKEDSTCGQGKGKESYLYFFSETRRFHRKDKKTGREVRVFFLEMERGLQLFQMKGIHLRLLYRGLTEQVEKHLMQITARY